MQEYMTAGPGARRAMLGLHDDPVREYACDAAVELPDAKIGTFTRALNEKGKKQGRTVINMKNDRTGSLAWE